MAKLRFHERLVQSFIQVWMPLPLQSLKNQAFSGPQKMANFAGQPTLAASSAFLVSIA